MKTNEKILNLYVSGVKRYSDIAKKIGVSRQRVWQICKKYELEPDKRGKATSIIEDNIETIKTLNERYDRNEIADYLGVKLSSLIMVLREKFPDFKFKVKKHDIENNEKIAKFTLLYSKFDGNYTKIAKSMGYDNVQSLYRFAKNNNLRKNYPAKGRETNGKRKSFSNE